MQHFIPVFNLCVPKYTAQLTDSALKFSYNLYAIACNDICLACLCMRVCLCVCVYIYSLPIVYYPYYYCFVNTNSNDLQFHLLFYLSNYLTMTNLSMTHCCYYCYFFLKINFDKEIITPIIWSIQSLFEMNHF